MNILCNRCGKIELFEEIDGEFFCDNCGLSQSAANEWAKKNKGKASKVETKRPHLFLKEDFVTFNGKDIFYNDIHYLESKTTLYKNNIGFTVKQQSLCLELKIIKLNGEVISMICPGDSGVSLLVGKNLELDFYQKEMLTKFNKLEEITLPLRYNEIIGTLNDTGYFKYNGVNFTKSGIVEYKNKYVDIHKSQVYFGYTILRITGINKSISLFDKLFKSNIIEVPVNYNRDVIEKVLKEFYCLPSE